ncbi:MAG: hypothetical protein JW809_07880 [Pirellulales bacterium]|nr:hypothetical protein [Pirellulales bacterium]
MNRHHLTAISVFLALLLLPAAAESALIWDTTTGDDGGITMGDGVWQDGGPPNWNVGADPWNVAWNNAAPDAAQFGTSSGSTTHYVTVSGTVKAAGVTAFRTSVVSPDADNGGTIELVGASPAIVTYYRPKYYVGFTTSPDVETVRLEGAGTSSRYLYLYGTSTFDAPAVIGGAGLLAMLHSDATSQGNIQGASAAGITIEAGSTLSFRADNFTSAKPFTISGTGLGSRGALEFSTSYTSEGVRDLQGPLTLAGDAMIRIQVDPAKPEALINTISGPISGDYEFTVLNAATGSAYPAPIHLTNPANAIKSLIAFSTGSGGSPVLIYLDADFTATEKVSIGNKSTVFLGADADLDTPWISLDHATATLDASAGGLVLAAGQTLQGIGSVLGNVTADAGSAIMPGMSPGTLTVAGNLDMSAGAGMTWELASLVDNADGAPGADFDLATVTGDLVLGGTSHLTLDLSAVGDPDAGVAFWKSNHTWRVIEVGSGTTGNFNAVTNGSFAAGTFGTTVVDNDVLLHFVAVPEPSLLALLAGGLALLPFGRRGRR